MDFKFDVMIMSGVEDGSVLKYNSGSGDGQTSAHKWTLTIGRRDDNDVCLRNDTYISRQHAKLHYENAVWQLEDCNSTNGTFIENPANSFEDTRVNGTIPLQIGQLFRVGRTWLRIQISE
ncbi:MAG: FHA domain-containing protein [Chloroflexi bacterium]|nr:FHA domain-containing protein [Chloroflexota bacterium]